MSDQSVKRVWIKLGEYNNLTDVIEFTDDDNAVPQKEFNSYCFYTQHSFRPMEGGEEYVLASEYDKLKSVLEAVRSQMCWERDRDQLTMGFKDLHDDVTKVLGRDET
jgi:hypothetical protein